MSELIVFFILIMSTILLYLVNAYIPLRRRTKTYLNVAIMIVIIVLSIKTFDFDFSQNGDSHLEINRAAMTR